jgi:ABC-2 type transport system ATP-binding protein
MSDRATATAVRATDLAREYEPGRGVCGVDLDIAAGECFALLGRNGSGKSTLTRLLIAEERADRGILEVHGIDVTNPSESRRVAHLESLGIAMDASVHWEKVSGLDNASFTAHAYGMGSARIDERSSQLFALAGLADQAEDPVGNYSFGMKRKLSIVEAIAHDPALLVLDEPTSGVDAQFSAALADVVRDRSARGRTTWVASNDPEWVSEVATRVAFIHGGRFIRIGTVAELLSDVTSSQEIRVTLSSADPIARPSAAGVQSFHQHEDGATIVADDDPALVPKIMAAVVAAGGAIKSLEVRRPGLRDAFLLATGEDLEQ